MSKEARELAQRFGVRMCDENGMTHGEELYCLGLDDIIAMKEALAKQEQRCEYCDGTGDVHDQTGEWRGVCVCEAGAKQEQGEPVHVSAEDIKEMARLHKEGRWAPDANHPQPKREPLTDEWIRSKCKQTWVFDTVKQWVREVEAAHGIKE